MNTYINPAKEMWDALCQRPQLNLEFLNSSVQNILTRVKKSGDSALREFTQLYDKANIQSLRVTEEEFLSAETEVSDDLKKAIRKAAENITKFHEPQRPLPLRIETMPGVTCWRKAVPIEKVGIYIPGGSAPLFSTVLMLAVPAKLAGCSEIILCTPPDNNGKINAAILYAAKTTGITKVFKVGGAQAIAAMAYGTESIPQVSKIFGPGNQYVTKAKQLISQEGIAIDMPAGPSEMMIIMDEFANPEFVAADLLSQAEHGTDSQVMLLASQENLLVPVLNALDSQLKNLNRKEIARESLMNSRAIVFNNREDLLTFTNLYSAEHLIINTRDAAEFAEKVINAGSVFIGQFAAEAIGDYASGTNHTLPTNGFAKAYSGVSLESFMKFITFQEINETGLRNIGPLVETLADAENLAAHKNAVTIRLNTIR